jgi:Iap family predicted aminopeptidase
MAVVAAARKELQAHGVDATVEPVYVGGGDQRQRANAQPPPVPAGVR